MTVAANIMLVKPLEGRAGWPVIDEAARLKGEPSSTSGPRKSLQK